MAAEGAKDIDTFVLRAYGQAEAALADLGLPEEANTACFSAHATGADLRAAAGDAFAAWVSAARLRNTAIYAERVIADPRYSAEENATPPNKIGSTLVLFDCLTCDKCIPLCPNDANFSFVVPQGETPVERATSGADGWKIETIGALKFAKPKQMATFADVCNECGNCDVLCPEDGGPYMSKPLFFGSLASFEAASHRDGFFVESHGGEGIGMRGRFRGEVVRMERIGDHVRYSGEDFDLTFDPNDVAATITGMAGGPVDFTRLRIMMPILEAVTAPGAVNYVSAALEAGEL
jgi:putative selenate reductase